MHSRLACGQIRVDIFDADLHRRLAGNTECCPVPGEREQTADGDLLIRRSCGVAVTSGDDKPSDEKRRELRYVLMPKIHGSLSPSRVSVAINSRQNAGMSATMRPHTRLPSRNAGSSTQVAPALTRSSLMPSDPVALRPRTMPAEIATSPPWQMIAIVFPAAFICWTNLVTDSYRRSLSGAHPPG